MTMSLRLTRWLLLLGAVALFWWLLHIQLTVPPAQALRSGQELLGKRRVLALVAHPDDLEWYIGGTLHRLSQQGAQVEVIVASDGERGPNRTHSADLRATRRAEQEQAGLINGYTHIHFLGLPDRQVAAQPNLIPRVAEIYQQLKPQAVFIFDPEFPSYPYLHTDHQGSARAFIRYWQTLPLAQRAALYLFQSRRPDVAVDISNVIDSKEQAMAQHVSQGGSSPFFKRFFAADGKRVGVPYAELFRKVEAQ